MTTEELVAYWIAESDADYDSMMEIYNNSKQYHWVLFVGHLCIEKLIKAIFVKNNTQNVPPKSHDLTALARKANISLDDAKEDMLDIVTTFNIETRYRDYQNNFYKLCTKQFTDDNLKIIKELRTWLKKILVTK